MHHITYRSRRENMAGKNKDIAILVRHGESLANFRKIVSEDIDGFPLTELGAKQSVRAGRTLIPIAGRVDSFISSPIIRAIQTGSGVMKGMGIRREIIQEPLLIETKFGKYNCLKNSPPIFFKRLYPKFLFVKFRKILHA